MNEDTFYNIVKSIERNKSAVKVIVLYHGGEPLLNNLFFDFVVRLKQIDDGSLLIKTVSNGTVLTAEASSSLVDCGIDEIEFSLDGVSAQDNQMIRRKSNTKQIISNIKALINLIKTKSLKKPMVSIATTQFMREVPAVAGSVEAAVVPGWLKHEFHDDVKYKATYAIKWPHMGEHEHIHVRPLKTVERRLNHCDHVVSTITIRYNGDVVPCCYDLTGQMAMGNVNNEFLEQIWNNQKYRILRKSIRTRSYAPMCARCAVVSQPEYLVS
jgi:radical SAM protein with 4Fe4S-binding SPASM domain